MTHENIEALLAPESIAIVGASPDSWYSSRLIDNLLSYGFDGEVFYVNPSRETIRGEPCYDTIGDVPSVVDLVVVSIPREYVVETVREAAAMGVPAALVISAGFGEADETGAALEADLADLASEYGIALCGPNTIGLANMQANTVISATCSRKPEPGSIGLVSQSGALAFSTFYDRATDEDLRFSAIIATGNEAGLTVTDYVEYLADEPTVDVICTYIEGIEDPRRFMSAAARAIAGGTPVMTVKIGRTDDAERASISHTGSVTGNDDAWAAAFEQTGVQRVQDIPDLLNRASAHTRFDPPAGDNVCIASTSGGLASLLADLASQAGLSIPPLSPATESALVNRDDLLTFGELGNPADIRGYGADILPEIAETLFADDRFDAYLFAIGLPAVGERAEPLVEDLLTVADMAADPVVFLWTGRKVPTGEGERTNPEGLPFERLRRAAPLYYDPARAVDALGSLVDFGQRVGTIEPKSWDVDGESERVEADRSSGSVLAALEGPEAGIPSWETSTALLESVGLEPVETAVVTAASDAVEQASALGYPVVMKADPAAIAHRTEVGAVVVGIESAEDARDAFETIATAIRDHGESDEEPRVLVQPMVDGVEVLVGGTRDPGFGPVLTVGVGGEYVELLEEQTVLIPPVQPDEIEAALSGTTVARLLAGYRGAEAVDSAAVYELIASVGDLLLDVDRIEELDLNPVIATPDGVGVVDILCRLD